MIKIIKYPNKILTVPCLPVVDFKDSEFILLCKNMRQAMFEQGARGLAANQIGSTMRVVVYRPHGVVDKDGNMVFLVNPKLDSINNIEETYLSEGCLSFPGASTVVKRYQHIRVTAQDMYGNITTSQIFSGPDAVSIQHEVDHINGITISDKIDKLSKKAFLKKVRRAVNRSKI